MKKLLVVLGFLFLVTGCDTLMNSPTNEVENFLSKYQKQDSSVINQLDDVIDKDETLNDTQKKDYRDLMKKQYQNLTYKIKEETIDGDNATVEVEIEVYDYYKAMDNADKYLVSNNQDFLDQEGNVDNSKFMDYKITKMKDVKDKVTYTLNLTLTKDDDEWELDDITDVDRQKIHGIYNY